MRAIILAAGRGSRLGPYGQDKPKCQVEFAGMTLIERQLATLRGGGVDDIVIVTGYRSEQMQFAGITLRHNADWADTNMVETLFCADALLEDDIVVSYADIIYEPRVLQALVDSPHEISVAVDLDWRTYWEFRFDDPLSDAETLTMTADGTISEIGNEPEHIKDIEGQYLGLMRFRGDGIAALRKAYSNLGKIERPWTAKRPVQKAYMTDLIMELILGGDAVHAVPVESGWLEIDTAEDYEKVCAMAEDRSIARFFDPAATPVAATAR